MNSVREIQRLNKLELEQGISPSASWHTDYRDTAYVYVGGLSYDLTEGDVGAMFSQFGEPTFVKLARDKTTGKSRGFGWVKYEDQRSCDLAVDNLGGATVLGRVIRVDHTRYQRRDDESDGEKPIDDEQPPNDRGSSEDEKPRRAPLKEEVELQKLLTEHDDDDPMKEYLVNEKKADVEKALGKQRRREERHAKRNKRSDEHYERPSRHREGSVTSNERRGERRHRDREDDTVRRRHDSDKEPENARTYGRDKHGDHSEESHRRRRRYSSTDEARPSPRRRHRQISEERNRRSHKPRTEQRDRGTRNTSDQRSRSP